MVNDNVSPKAVEASSNVTPCFWLFESA